MAFREYNRLNVLVLDDFDGFRSSVSRMLESFGVPRVDSANNAVEALRLCRAQNYDAILSDYNLGKGQTGLQLLEELRYHDIIRRSQVFVLVSAENSKQIVLAASDVEPDAYLSKPITVKTLQQRLDRILVQRSQLGELFAALDRADKEKAIAVCQDHIHARGHQSAFCQKYLGQMLIETGDLDEAELVYRSVLEVRPLEWAKIGMACVKHKRGDLNTAERWFRELIASNPLCLKAYDGLADVYQSLDDDSNLQQVLEDAVSISPLALLRQESLAKAATKNCDFETAARAYRRVIRLADYSVYQTPEQNLSYARAALRLSEQNSQAALEFGRDAIGKLWPLPSVLPGQDIHLQSLLLQTQLYVQQKDQRQADKQFAETFNIIENEAEKPLSFDVEVEMVKTLRSVGQPTQANDKLLALCEQYHNDEAKLEVLDNLLGEPKSEKNRKLITRINKEGIRHYQAKHYAEAMASFNYAKRLFPNHLGVQLNLVQVMLEEMDQFGCKTDMVTEVETTLNKVNEAITPTHEQFHRFVKLKEMYHALLRNKK